MIEKMATAGVVLLLAAGAFTAGINNCANAAEYTESSFGAVECCCRTANGGTCCGIVTFCGGFIPGCFCQ